MILDQHWYDLWQSPRCKGLFLSLNFGSNNNRKQMHFCCLMLHWESCSLPSFFSVFQAGMAAVAVSGKQGELEEEEAPMKIGSSVAWNRKRDWGGLEHVCHLLASFLDDVFKVLLLLFLPALSKMDRAAARWWWWAWQHKKKNRLKYNIVVLEDFFDDCSIYIPGSKKETGYSVFPTHSR